MQLKQLRASKKITQAKFAAEIGVSRSTVAMWETGGNEPDTETFKQIADYFGVSIDEVIGRETTEQTKKPTIVSDDERLDHELISALVGLTPSENQRVLDFVAGMKARREDQPSPALSDRK